MMRSFPAVASILLCLAVFACRSIDDSARKSESTQADAPRLASAGQNRDSIVITLIGADSTNVFDLLNASHRVDYQASAIGAFVKSIDSIHATADAFWVYSVNDTMGEVAANKRPVQAGDTIRWHLRKNAE